MISFYCIYLWFLPRTIRAVLLIYIFILKTYDAMMTSKRRVNFLSLTFLLKCLKRSLDIHILV